MKLIENGFFVTLKRTLYLGLVNIKRNGILSFGVIAVTAILLFIFNILLIVNFTASSAIHDLSSKIDFIIYLKDDTSQYDAERMVVDIKSMEGIKSVKFISKEEAFTVFKKNHPETADFFEKYNLRNPLPPSIHILTEKSEYYFLIEKSLKESKYKNFLENIVEGRNDTNVIKRVSENLEKITLFTKNIIWGVIVVFIIGSILIIGSAIHITIYSRRSEINIMKLVGAKPYFIKLPFIFEACFYAIIAALISFAGTIILLLNKFLGGFAVLQESSLPIGTLFIIELIVAVFLGALSSTISVHRHIKQHFLK